MESFIIFLGIILGVIEIIMIVYFFKLCDNVLRILNNVRELVEINKQDLPKEVKEK